MEWSGNGPLGIDWSRYRLKADVVAREVTSLTPFVPASITLPVIAAADFAVLLDSVQANGVFEPLTVTPDGRVVDGHARLEAARRAHIHQVATRVLESSGGDEDYAQHGRRGDGGGDGRRRAHRDGEADLRRQLAGRGRALTARAPP